MQRKTIAKESLHLISNLCFDYNLAHDANYKKLIHCQIISVAECLCNLGVHIEIYKNIPSDYITKFIVKYTIRGHYKSDVYLMPADTPQRNYVRDNGLDILFVRGKYTCYDNIHNFNENNPANIRGVLNISLKQNPNVWKEGEKNG